MVGKAGGVGGGGFEAEVGGHYYTLISWKICEGVEDERGPCMATHQLIQFQTAPLCGSTQSLESVTLYQTGRGGSARQMSQRSSGPPTHRRPAHSHLPRTSTMTSTSQRQRGRGGVHPALDASIQKLNLANNACGIPPARAVFGSTSVLLITIKVHFSPLCCKDKHLTHLV